MKVGKLSKEVPFGKIDYRIFMTRTHKGVLYLKYLCLYSTTVSTKIQCRNPFFFPKIGKILGEI